MTVTLRLFATARQAAGRSSDHFDLGADATLDDLVAAAVARYGDEVAAVLPTARVWLNGEEPAASGTTRLHPDDEVAVLPPVSGGAG